MKETKSTCPYCGVGCGVIIESEGAQITGVRGDPAHPANFGRLCSKGSTLHLTASAPVTLQTRLLQPMQRLTRGAAPQAVTWDDAMQRATDTFARIIRDHGADAVGFYVSGQLLTEDYYAFNKLAKGLIGTNNIDTNSRLCMSSAVAGYKKTLGADAPPSCYDDVNHAQTLFITGSNTAYAHPVLFRRIEDAKRANPSMKLVVVDPRRTDTADMADLHLQIQPGTDVMLFNGMLHLMLWEGWTDAAYIAQHTNGFDALKATVRDCTPDAVAQVCGISKEALLEATRLFAGLGHVLLGSDGKPTPAPRQPTLSLYCQGLNQSSSGTAKNTALINLHLATGQIGKPGSGPFSLTGQPNAMGGREVGGLANLLSAHRDLANPAHRAEVAALWGIADVPSKPGKTAVEMFQAAADGEIKAMWIACTNPAQSMPDQATVRRALERAEFVVVQEAFATTATCAYADLLLPATTWGEKEGTVTNSERRISRVRAAVTPPTAAVSSEPAGRLGGEALCSVSPARDTGSSASNGNEPVPPEVASTSNAGSMGSGALCAGKGGDRAAGGGHGAECAATQTPSERESAPRHDWQIAVDFAQRMEKALGKTGPTLFPYATPESIWNEHRESTRGRDLDITGLTYAMLEEAPQQWPFAHDASTGTARLYEDGIFPTADGRAQFANVGYKPVAETRDARFPFSLNTGRLRDQWHGMSRTGTLGRLFGHVREPALQMHPQDMARRLLNEGDLVHVTSRRGSIVVPVQASAEQAMSQVFLAMHWGEEFVSGMGAGGQRLAGVNALTTPAFCPDSKQPEFKHTAVKVLKAELPFAVVAMAWLPPEQVLAARAQLQALMGAFAFATCVPFGGTSTTAAAGTTAGAAEEGPTERQGVLFRAASHEAVPAEVLERIEAVLQLQGASVLHYTDPKRGQRRSMHLQRAGDDTMLQGFLLAGDARAHRWISGLLQDEQPAQRYGRALLLAVSEPPVPVVSKGKVVCSCFNVRDAAIAEQLLRSSGSEAARLGQLQSALRCGTNCGSCVPELQRMVRMAVTPSPTPAALVA